MRNWHRLCPTSIEAKQLGVAWHCSQQASGPWPGWPPASGSIVILLPIPLLIMPYLNTVSQLLVGFGRATDTVAVDV